jgi:dipeptidyl aminopeptidase/acylaminoacyl peptidase
LVFCRWWVWEFSKVTEKTSFWLLGRFAEMWYIVFAPQYAWNDWWQGLDEVWWQDLEDVLVAPDVFNSFLWHNLENIWIYAMSRWAIMAYKTLAKVDWIVAMVVVWWLTNVERNISARPDILEARKDRFPQNIVEYRNRSAICFVDKLPKNVPILMMHWLCDWRVSPQDTLDLSARFFEYKIPHRLICFDWADHWLTEVRDESIDYSIKWFDRFVRYREGIPSVILHGA